MRFSQFLAEKKEKDEQEKKIVFKETDGRSPFPANTISALERQISASARDLELEWHSSAELVDSAFTELDVPRPESYNAERWPQYVSLLSYAIKELYKSRGLKSNWSITV